MLSINIALCTVFSVLFRLYFSLFCFVLHYHCHKKIELLEDCEMSFDKSKLSENFSTVTPNLSTISIYNHWLNITIANCQKKNQSVRKFFNFYHNIFSEYVIGVIQKLRRQEGVGGWLVKYLHLQDKWALFIYFVCLRGVGGWSK